MRQLRYLLQTVIAVSWCNISWGAPASSLPATYRQPDGTNTPELFLRGDERYAWLTDAGGFTVLRDTNGWYVYARKTEDGNLVPLDNALVGLSDPKELSLEPNLLHDSAFRENKDDSESGILRLRHRRKLPGLPKAILCDHEATSVDPCYLKQLALMVRFADHSDRLLPSTEDINVLFNHNGPTGTNTAPTGSISDAYRANSFDRFVLDTHVSGWIQISKTEAYCSGGQNGFNLPETRECWAEALEKYAETLGDGGLKVYDEDGDGYIDGMAIVHSGAPAEENGEDCETKALYNNRIWSHSVPLAPNFEFTSEFGKDVGVKAGRFYVFGGVVGVCPPEGPGMKWDTGRIAVGVHEGGHFLGLKDLYGKPGVDYGIGNWGFMGNMHGWDTSGNYPGLMSGYSRHLLGWLEVVDITFSQEVTVLSSCDSDKIYRITHRMASDEFGEEYFLIENRQPCGHDVQLLHDGRDRQGIIIWHVDNTGLLGQVDGIDVILFNTGRAPTSPDWPKLHGRASVLQGDGLFDLENNVNKGDESDSFRVQSGAANIAKMISNEGVTMNDGSVKKYPNTKSIAYGEERETGITIEILDVPQNSMRVKVTLLDSSGASIDSPPVPETTSVPNGQATQGPIAGSTFTQYSYTQAPATPTTNLPVPSPTVLPVAENVDYTCDNSEFEEFEVTGLGENPSMNIIKQCQFIKPDKRDPMEWCNALDMWNNNQPVYMKCQIECSIITGCQSPSGGETASLQTKSVASSTNATAPEQSKNEPVTPPTSAPVVPSTTVPVLQQTTIPAATPTATQTSAPLPAPTSLPVVVATSPPQRTVTTSPLPKTTEPPVGPSQQTTIPVATPPATPIPAQTTSIPVVVATNPPQPAVTTLPIPQVTAPPVDPSTSTLAASPTTAPVVTVGTTSGEYTCDNSEYEEFEVTGLGDTPTMNLIKQCQFIKPDKRDPLEWCNASDMWNKNQPVYLKCQRECYMITNCPPPERLRLYLRH